MGVHDDRLSVGSDPSLDVRRPGYFPSDTEEIDTWQEAIEVLRSQKFIQEPATENGALVGGALFTLNGAEHRQRRRAMNRLMTPEALDSYFDNILEPALTLELRELGASPTDRGSRSTELCSFARRLMLRVAGEIIGIGERTSDPGGLERLSRLHDAMSELMLVRWDTSSRHSEIIERGMEAKREWADHLHAPAVTARLHSSESVDAASSYDLLSHLIGVVDPVWEDDELAVREEIGLLIGTVSSTAQSTVNALHELFVWFETHPEDRTRMSTDPELLSHAVMEALRLHPTAPAIARIACDDVVLSNGRSIGAGQWVAVMALAVNTDASVYGATAHTFDPRRTTPSGVARYGISFGTGAHQCLGLRVVIGNAGIGATALILKTLLEAGVMPDPKRSPQRDEENERDGFAGYPVIFTRLEDVLRG